MKYGRIYGLYDKNILIGFCSWVHFSEDDYITLCNLTIKKDLWRKGFGTKIIKYVMSKKKGKSLLVQTNAKEFFEKLNFKITTDFEDDETQPYRYIMKYLEK
jgi:N-acetylglutamate synthase-like GNAT family acetyltransferase